MALFYACDVGTLDVVEFLISQRSDINAKDHVSIWMYIHIHANIKSRWVATLYENHHI